MSLCGISLYIFNKMVTYVDISNFRLLWKKLNKNLKSNLKFGDNYYFHTLMNNNFEVCQNDTNH